MGKRWLTAIFVVVAVHASGASANGAERPVLDNGRNQFTFLEPRKPAPLTRILAEDGSRFDLSRFSGRYVLLNFWATWCLPCVRELPSLQRLQFALGGQGFRVVALSVDDTDIAVPGEFMRQHGLQDLGVYLDVTDAATDTFPLYGLPITYLIDRKGAVIGYITGAVEWDSPAAIAFLRHYID